MRLRFQDWNESRAGYEALLLSDRKTLHRRVAESIEAVAAASEGGTVPEDASLRAFAVAERGFPEWLSPSAQDLARHWHAAGEPRRGGLFRLQAARDSVLGGRVAEAAAGADLAREWLVESGDRLLAAAADLERGRVKVRVGKFAEALQLLRDALDWLAENETEPASLLRIRLVLNRANALESMGRYEEASDLAGSAVASARALGSPAEIATSVRLLGSLSVVRGDYAGAEPYFREALELHKKIGDVRGIASVLMSLGATQWQRGLLDEALASYTASREIHKSVANHAGLVIALNNIGAWYWSRGDYPAAIQCHEQALALRRTGGDRPGEAASLNNLGIIHDALGESEEALRRFDVSRQIRIEITDRRGLAVTTANIAWSRLVTGDAAGALPEAQRAVEMAEKLAVEDLLCESLATRSIARARLGDRAGAKEDADRAFVLAEKTRNAVERIWARVAVAYATGAQAPALEAVEFARKLGNPVYLCESLLCAAEVLVQAGRAGLARPALEETLKLAAKYGAAGMRRRAEAFLALRK